MPRTFKPSSVVGFLFASCTAVPAVVHNVQDPLVDQEKDRVSKLVDEALDEREFNPLFPIGTLEGSVMERDRLTGDWGGSRTALAERGMLVNFDGVFIGGSVLDGGSDEDQEFLQKGDLTLKFDTDRGGLWPGGFGSVRVETRLGNSSNPDAGTLMPVNTVALFPATNEEDDTVDLSEVVFVQFLTEWLQVFGGLLQTLDGDLIPGASERGVDSFLNLALVLNPLLLQAVPYSTLGFGVTLFPSKNFYGGVSILDTEESSGHDKFDNTGGTTVISEWYTVYDINECFGGFKVGMMYADHDFTSLDQDPRNFLPPGSVETSDDTWAFHFNAYQSFAPSVVDRFGRRRSWGIGTRFGWADDDTNPFEWYVSTMAVGRGMMDSRPRDHYGIGWYHMGLTDQDFIDLLPVDDEDGFEAFYNYSVTPAVSVTLDLQYIDTGLEFNDEAWVVQLRTTVRL